MVEPLVALTSKIVLTQLNFISSVKQLMLLFLLL